MRSQMGLKIGSLIKKDRWNVFVFVGLLFMISGMVHFTGCQHFLSRPTLLTPHSPFMSLCLFLSIQEAFAFTSVVISPFDMR